MIQNLFTVYGLKYATVIAYMLQNTEYQVAPYLAWYWRTQDFAKVMYRRQLVPTKAARLLRLTLVAGMAGQLAAGLAFIIAALLQHTPELTFFGMALIISYPLIWAHLIVVPLLLGRWLVIAPRNRVLIHRSRQIFHEHPGKIVAVAGSYGNTSMKEILTAVLGDGKKVAATPGNKNVPSSHAQFAASLEGDEDVLIIEYGEGKPGDVAKFCQTTDPDFGIITGLAPAHLDKYKTLANAGKDIFALAHYVDDKQHIFVNGECQPLESFIDEVKDVELYSRKGIGGWHVSNVVVSPTETSFTLSKKSKKLTLSSGLLGAHQVGPLSAAAVIGLELGLTNKQVETGIANTKPFEHRMQSYQLGGAWIIDDTYNGNIEGIRAGTELLAKLDAKRKLYVTPGLVEQGPETKRVHVEMGQLIGAAKPDIVVLMQNSTTTHIQQGLEEANFAGEVRVETHPLDFYANLEHFVATGDVALMQNDWTDNYA